MGSKFIESLSVPRVTLDINNGQIKSRYLDKKNVDNKV